MDIGTLFAGALVFSGGIFMHRNLTEEEKMLFRVERTPYVEVEDAVLDVPAKVHGMSQEEPTVEAPYSKTKCLWYHSLKEKEVHRRKSTEWVIEEELYSNTPFNVTDTTGTISVNLTGAKHDVTPPYNIDAKQVMNWTGGEGGSTNVLGLKLQMGQRIRKREWVLLPGQNVFVYGTVTGERTAKEIRQAKEEDIIISAMNEADYMEANRASAVWNHLLAFGLLFVGLVLGGAGILPEDFVLQFALLAAAAIAAVMIVSYVNSLISLGKRVGNAWAEIDIQLKRRYDLVPNLVEVVKGYASHEKETFEKIASMRSQYLSTERVKDKGDASNDMEEGIKTLLAVSENYPQLKANESFKKLQETLADLEDYVAYSRSFYNKSVLLYNIAISQIPGMFFAPVLGMKPADFFGATEEERKPATVKI
jgi:LemA protein